MSLVKKSEGGRQKRQVESVDGTTDSYGWLAEKVRQDWLCSEMQEAERLSRVARRDGAEIPNI